MKKLTLFLAPLLIGCTACGQLLAPLAGEWGQGSKYRNDVNAVTPGMTAGEVTVKIGAAQKINASDGVYVGWQEWVYPTGSVLMQRGKVHSVYALPATEEVIADLQAANQKKKFNWKEFGWEGDKKSVQERDAKESQEREDSIWGNTVAPRKTNSGATLGAGMTPER
jgi:hypothetical protein